MQLRQALPAVALAAFSCVSNPPRESSLSPTLFVGGTVAAGPNQAPERNLAIYVESGRIRDIGPAASFRHRYASARVVDATGATILPGLTDAHAHLYGLGLSLEIVRLVGTTSFAEIVERVAAKAQSTPEGNWVIGRGWDQNDWFEKEFPTKDALDTAVPSHPVWLRRIDGHAGIANSSALNAAGITAATPDPPGGRIMRHPNGEPTGVLIDAAMALVDRKTAAPTYQVRKSRVLAAAIRIAENGLTEIHDAGADADTIRAVHELIDEKRLPIRVYTMLSDDASLLGNWLARKPMVDYGGRLTVRSVKLYADGALGSRGAALLEPYSDERSNRGLMVSSVEHMTGVARRAIAAGFQVNAHAIGDRGVRNVIDAYEAAGGAPEHRLRIEHLQVVAPADFPRLARAGIIASFQPTHATSDMYWAEARVGATRIRGAYAWRTILDANGRIALGSDFPVEEVNPFHGIHAAVTRQDQKGWPEGGWYPEQKLTLAEAIRGFTIDAAYAAFEEGSRGTIEPGKLADFTIVEGDLYSMPPSELFKAKVRYTVVGGEIAYRGVK